ncbi:hypothetical protein BDZ97DRAFT_298726 [Flammula alnicola]|nr:hypothetical protein BDZ97DRAFT_298726 [Flammula alnicola]
MTNLKYLDIYEDDSKNVLYDDDEPLDFTGSLGGKKTRPLYILYDIQKAENPSEDEDESGDESNSGDDTNSEEDDSDGPNRNYTLRLQATRSCGECHALFKSPNPFSARFSGRVRDYMAMNIGDYSYTDGALHTMPNAMSGLEYYLAEKRNRRGKVTDRGWVDRRFATLLYN